jgi:hypothetical protein
MLAARSCKQQSGRQLANDDAIAASKQRGKQCTRNLPFSHCFLSTAVSKIAESKNIHRTLLLGRRVHTSTLADMFVASAAILSHVPL